MPWSSERDEILLENGRACIERAASQLRAARDAYERADADAGIRSWLECTIQDVEALADVDA